jgi:hypothetical protein
MKIISFKEKTNQRIFLAYMLLKERYANKVIKFNYNRIPNSGNLYNGNFVIS